MQFTTTDECRLYVEAELDGSVRFRTGWHTEYGHGPIDLRGYTAPDMPKMTWKIWHDGEDDWYTLHALMDEKEFLVWFGNHQVGAEGLHWIVRPALHVAFDDLWPRSDPLMIKFSLGDILNYIISSLEMPRQMRMRFEMNSFSLT